MAKFGGRKWIAAILSIVSFFLKATVLPELDADGVFMACLVFIVAEGTLDLTRIAIAVVQSWRSGSIQNEELLPASTDEGLGDV